MKNSTEKQRRGPKTEFSFEDKFRECSMHEIFMENGVLKNKKDEVWIEICQELNKKINPTKPLQPLNLYIYVYENRDGIQKKLRRKEKSNLLDNATELENQPNVDNLYLKSEEKLWKMKTNALYKAEVNELTVYPFTIIHWSVEAIDYSNASASPLYFLINGEMCKNFIAPDGSSSKTIFLSSLGIIEDSSHDFIPICQISSECHSLSEISRFFLECVRNGLKRPDFIKVEYFKNYYIAANSVFNVDITYETYLMLCYHFLKEKQLRPRCIITTDIRLMCIQVLKWDSIKNIQLESKKNFFVYCIILLSYQNNIKDFENLLEKIVLILLSPFKSDETKKNFGDIKKEIQNKKIETYYSKTYLMELQNQFEIICENEITIDIDYEECKDILINLKTIFNKAKVNITNNNAAGGNPHFNAKFCMDVLKLCVEFPIWTNVMNTEIYTKGVGEIEKYSTEFSDKFTEKRLVHDYLLDIIDHNSKILRCKKGERQNFGQGSNKNIDDDFSFLQYEENWKGQNIQEIEINSDTEYDDSSEEISDESESELENESSPEADDYDDTQDDISQIIMNSTISNDKEIEIKEKSNVSLHENITEVINSAKSNLKEDTEQNTVKKSRGKFVKPCKNYHLIHQKPNETPRKRKRIKNYRQISTAKKVGSIKKYVTTSSVIDSIVELLTSGYYNVDHFKNFIDNTNVIDEKLNQSFLKILKEYITTFDLITFYKNRFDLIRKTFDENNDLFSWDKTVGEYFEKVIHPNIFRKITHSANDLPPEYVQSSKIELLPEQLISEEFNLAILEAISPVEMFLCVIHPVCNIDVTCDVGDILCIDVENKSTENNLINLKDLHKTVSLFEKSYTLVGAISFTEPIGGTPLRHYVAYCRNISDHETWEKFDSTSDSDKGSALPLKEAVFNIALVIYLHYTKKSVCAQEKNYFKTKPVKKSKK